MFDEAAGGGPPPPPQETRLDILRKQLPEDFFRRLQLSEIGISQDYRGRLLNALPHAHALLRPDKDESEITMANTHLLPALKSIETYSEYIRRRIDEHNSSMIEGGKLLDIDEAMQLLVGGQENATEIDEFALAARALAGPEEQEDKPDPQEVARRFYELLDPVIPFLDTPERILRLRKDFRLGSNFSDDQQDS